LSRLKTKPVTGMYCRHASVRCYHVCLSAHNNAVLDKWNFIQFASFNVTEIYQPNEMFPQIGQYGAQLYMNVQIHLNNYLTDWSKFYNILYYFYIA